LQILANSNELIVTTLEYSLSGTANYSLSNYNKLRLNSEYFSDSWNGKNDYKNGLL